MKGIQVRLTNAALMLLLCSVSALAQVKGSGTTNYIPVWTASGTIGDSIMYQTSGRIGIGTITPQFALDVGGHINTGEGYAIGETVVLTTPGGGSLSNLALGNSALADLTTGDGNTALGYYIFAGIDTGSGNTVTGGEALFDGFNGASSNTANGAFSLLGPTTANANTAVGAWVLANNDANNNTGIGYTAILLGDGVNNIAIGANAGAALNAPPDTNNDNIDIGNEGTSSDTDTIRIGTSGTQTSFFVAGVGGVTTGEDNAVPVVVDSNGQLGTVSSSRRFKTDIQDMGDASRELMRLRPVTFRYKKPFSDGSTPMQYGLIAEEVAEVYPDLVAHSADGQIETVKYQVLDSMLLNEVQRQQAEIEAQKNQMQDLQNQINELKRLVDSLSERRSH
jgi:hypothetical protein